jgi:drug/metabolite transporter (DMT)-like permease
LTASYCVLVPFLYWAIAKTRPNRYHLGAAFLLLTGIGFVSLTGDFTISVGDWLTLLCAVFYALHIISVSIFSKDRDIFLLTVLQFFTTGVLSWICFFLFETMPQSLSLEALGNMFYLIVFASAGALLFQNVGQKYCPPAAASVLLALESVFGVLCSLIFYGDVLTPRLALGFVLIFTAVLCSETKFSFLRKRGVPACPNESSESSPQ